MADVALCPCYGKACTIPSPAFWRSSPSLEGAGWEGAQHTSPASGRLYTQCHGLTHAPAYPVLSSQAVGMAESDTTIRRRTVGRMTGPVCRTSPVWGPTAAPCLLCLPVARHCSALRGSGGPDRWLRARYDAPRRPAPACPARRPALGRDPRIGLNRAPFPRHGGRGG